MISRLLLPVCLLLATLPLCPQKALANVVEETFTVPLHRVFALDVHGGPGVSMRVGEADGNYVDLDIMDEFRRGWTVHTEKHHSVQGREANLTLLYRHMDTGFEVYYLNTPDVPNGQATIVTRKYH